MSQDCNNVSMFIGGNLDKKLQPALLEILEELTSSASVKTLKRNLSRYLKGTSTFDTDILRIEKTDLQLSIWARHTSRLDDLETFCKENNLPFMVFSQEVAFGGDGAEINRYYQYGWEPGWDYVQTTDVDYRYSEVIGKADISNYLKAARECLDFKTLPSKINNESCITREFAERCLAGENLTAILLEKIEGQFQKERVLPEFKVGTKNTILKRLQNVN